MPDKRMHFTREPYAPRVRILAHNSNYNCHR